jgi:ubiquinone/menaquinone biosynthesis C-methylase UbiE
VSGNEAQRKDWNNRAAEWAAREEWTQAALASLSEPLIALARPGMRVLDVGTGSGQPALTVAPLVQPGGNVLGVDFSSEMLGYARANARRLGIENVRFQELDGEEISFPAGSFDLALARMSLMFMAQPLRALRGIRNSLTPGGRFACLLWTTVDRNPWVGLPERLAAKHFDLPRPQPGEPGMFALGGDGVLAGLLTEAGFRDVEARQLSSDFVFESAEQFWELRGRFTLSRCKTPPSEQEVAAFRADVLEAVEPFKNADGRYRLAAEAVYGSGAAP